MANNTNMSRGREEGIGFFFPEGKSRKRRTFEM